MFHAKEKDGREHFLIFFFGSLSPCAHEWLSLSQKETENTATKAKPNLAKHFSCGFYHKSMAFLVPESFSTRIGWRKEINYFTFLRWKLLQAFLTAANFLLNLCAGQETQGWFEYILNFPFFLLSEYFRATSFTKVDQVTEHCWFSRTSHSSWNIWVDPYNKPSTVLKERTKEKICFPNENFQCCLN